MSNIKVGDTITGDATHPRSVGEKVTGVVVQDIDSSGSGFHPRPFYRVDPTGGGQVRHVRADNAVLVRGQHATEIVKGDRVRYTAKFNGRDASHIGAEGAVGSSGNTTVRVAWDNGWVRTTVYRGNVEKIEAKKAAHADLIGKAPEVKAPKHVAPFKAVTNYVYDGNGVRFASVDSDHGDYEAGEDSKLAEVIAAALNAYFEESK